MRERGPDGILSKTFSGEVFGGRKVFWLASDGEQADDYEKKLTQSSRLLQLMTVNAYTVEGLMKKEKEEAKKLIVTMPENVDSCWMCDHKEKAIADTGLCRTHNLYALTTRK